MDENNLRFVFRPQSVAVIGASRRKGSIGQALFANILLNGYTGIVYPVNMKAKSVLGVRAYPSVLHIPDEVELAILVVPALAVPAVLAECGQKGIKGAIVISAGFKELGPTGARLEKSVGEKARKYGISLVGPNCFGMINTDKRVRLNTTFGRVMPRHGNIAFVSQSGAVGIAALEYAKSEDVGLSKFISIGNKADVNENDILAYLKDDEETDVILLYLEDLVNPKESMRIAREITSHSTKPKPILAIKSGRTSEGAKAASSHTGALAGSDETYNAFFAQARILRVETINELFARAAALAYQPPPKGSRIAILTNAGGIGIMATDACIRNGLQMAKLTSKTTDDMKKHLPPTASTQNPVDIVGDADEQRYRTTLKLLAADENVDGIISIWTPTLMTSSIDIARTIADVGKNSKKPILGCLQTIGRSKEVREALLKSQIPHYQFPENAARAMAAMAQFAYWSKRPQGKIVKYDDTKPDVVRAIISKAKSRQPVFLSEPEGHEILKAYGLPVPEYRLVKTSEQAIKAAAEIGYPVVLKIVSPQILHKTDAGGVRINITDDAKMRDDFAGLLKTVSNRKPDADIWGVLVQKMALKGTETILGMKRDHQFGPLLMFGLGGILVEVLKDVVFRVAPISDISAESMVTGIKAYRILKGFRGEPPKDTGKIRECLQRLSQLVTDFEEFDEIDINPLLVSEKGKGALVLDARIVLCQS